MYSPSRYRPSRYPAGYAGAGSYGGGGSTNGYSGGGGYSNGYSHSHHHHHDSSSYMTSRAPTSHGPGYTSPYLSDRYSLSSRQQQQRSASATLPPMGPSSKRSAMSSSPTPPSMSSSGHRRAPPLSKRSVSLSPSRIDEFKMRESLTPIRTMIRESFSDEPGSRGINGMHHHHHPHHDHRSARHKSPSVGRVERTRDELIDSIIHTRTAENRVMPGMVSTTDWNERRAIRIDCDRVYPGVILGNGDTIKNVDYLRGIGVTHVLNTAERHVPVNPDKYPLNGISYYGFHVDDHPSANISRYFARTTDFIDEAVRNKGLVVVNCVMGWSRSATVVAAYLMMRKGMSSAEALETIRQSRPIRPNPGFLQQLADHENLLSKKLVWS